jgi:RNA polymerase sigma-70 factor (ECF subfamily)
VAAEPAHDPVDGGLDLAELYRKHAGFVWRSLRRFGVADEALEDVVHEVFMIVRRRLPEFDRRAAPTTPGAAPTTPGAAPTTPGAAPTTPGAAPTTPGAAPTTWLFGIARGVAANVRRSRARAEARHRLVPLGEAPPDPEQAALRAEALACVAEFLGDLDPHQREVFELVDIEGLRGPEVAELLATNLNVVYSRLRLARRKFEAFIDARAHAQRDRRAP